MMSFPRKKFLVIFGIFFIILAFPIGLLLREFYGLSDTMGTALPSFILGLGVGLLLASVFVSGNKKPASKGISDNNRDEDTKTEKENESVTTTAQGQESATMSSSLHNENT